MKNRINQIFELNNHEKYLVYKQAYYKSKTYYLAILLNKDNLTNKYEIFEEYNDNNRQTVKKLEDNSIKKLILKNLGFTND